VRFIIFLHCICVIFFRYISERWRTAELFTTVNLPCAGADNDSAPAGNIDIAASAQPAFAFQMVQSASKPLAMAADAADQVDECGAANDTVSAVGAPLLVLSPPLVGILLHFALGDAQFIMSRDPRERKHNHLSSEQERALAPLIPHHLFPSRIIFSQLDTAYYCP